MIGIWDTLIGAPTWVYILLVYLVYVGIKSMSPRTVSVKRMILFPLIFVVWSFYGLYLKLILGHTSLIVFWLVFLAAGSYFGWREVRHWHLTHDRHQATITIPGNNSTLVLIVLIFAVKFFWGFIYATQLQVSYWVYFGDTITSALISGFFVGRAGSFLTSYRKKA